GHLGGRAPLGALERGTDRVEGLPAHALGQPARLRRGAQPPEQVVDVVLGHHGARAEPFPVLQVALPLATHGAERGRLDQVLGGPGGAGGPAHGDVPRPRPRGHVGGVARGPPAAQHLDAVRVGQVDVEQDEVDRRAVQAAQRLGPGRGARRHGEAAHALDVARVRRGGDGVVLDDERADHVRTSGSRTVNSAFPASSTTPPWRWAALRTSASPSPRPMPSSGLVLNPRSNARSATSGAIPGPLSLTLSSTASSATPAPNRTHRGSGPSRAASIALSRRLPTMVTRSRGSAVPAGRCVPSSTRSSTPRSPAAAAFPTTSAATSGTAIPETTASVRCWAVSSSAVANSSASSARPSSISE